MLNNPEHRKKINRYGVMCMKEMMNKPTIENFFHLSYDFTLKTGLINRKIIRVIEDVSKHGMASQAMLGNPVFAIGDTEKLVKTLKDFGTIYVCRIDGKARVL